MTREQWDQRSRQTMQDIFFQYPTSELAWRHKVAYRYMLKHYGPRPPSPMWVIAKAALKALAIYVKSGGNMNFSWWKNFAKAVKSVLLVALASAVLMVLDAFSTQNALTNAGMPAWLAPVIAMVLAGIATSLRNYFKVAKGVEKIAGIKL